MTLARDIMHREAVCIGEHDTVAQAAQRMRDHNVGTLPICGDDNRLRGIVTDRDIVVKCLAAGRDVTSTTVGTLAQGPPRVVDSNADVHQVLNIMSEHRIRRVPVVDGERIVGIITTADLAAHLAPEVVGKVLDAVCTVRTR